jgi:hypothetical protein
MRYYVFISLVAIALALDLALLAAGLTSPQKHAAVIEPRVALAAPRDSTAQPTARPTSTALASPTTSPTAQPTPTASPTTLPPTATPEPQPRLLGSKSVSFTPGDRAVRANIDLALSHYFGALTHVVLAPGQVFSFNATLGLHPQGLPWKNVRIKSSATPPAEGQAAEPAAQIVQGGGICDLASRYVMAARPFLPARAFHFVNHVRSNGIHLSGVPERDSVSIWAIGGGKGEHDLTITNTTDGWIEWVVEKQDAKITVTTRLWDRSPPGW